jgi:glucose-6-phosphate isomerase
LAVIVTGPGSKLHRWAEFELATGVFSIPPDVGGRYSIFTACGLLPAAVLGIDVVKLLQGASSMTARFRSDSVGSSPVLDYTGVCHLMEQRRGTTIRVLSLWDQSLEAFGFWYDQLLSESLGKAEQGATPITAVNTRDLHSRGQQHQEGRRDKLITNVILKRVRRDALPVGSSDYGDENLDEISNKTLPDIMKAAIDGTIEAYKEDHRTSTNIYLPGADEFSLGQLYQMLMLATSLEGYLLGINPYGQPGVEAYKRHMKSFLRNDG